MTDVKLHDIGEGMTEAEVIRFFVQQGDSVQMDDPLLEVQTDKMTAELPSPAAGVVKEIKADSGDMIEVGSTIIVLENENEQAEPKPQPAPEDNSTAETPAVEDDKEKTGTTMKTPKTNHVLAAPYTRKIARDYQIDIEQVEGTGMDGRVTEADVYASAKQPQQSGQPGVLPSQANSKRPIASPAARKRAREHGLDLSQVQTRDPFGRIRTQDIKEHREGSPVEENSATEIPFKGRRRMIAQKMTQSIFTIPHVSHFDEVDVTNLFSLKQSLKASHPQKNASVAAFFIKGLQKALQEVPIFNAKLDEGNEVIRLEKEYNIGLATDTEEGLIVPVIHNVEQLSVLQIHEQMKELTQKAKDNRLRSADMSGGTFTISNVGPMGSTGATPIINYPEVALMAFHKTKKTPVVREQQGQDEIVIRQMMNVSMTFDHRVADGAKAVQFTNRFAEYLENPNLLLVEMI